MPSGLDIYRKSLRDNVRGLWSGSIDYMQFTRAMISTIDRRLRQAWLEGAQACGISENELTPEEQIAMHQAITNEFNFIEGFANDIEMGSKARGGKLKPLLIRVEMWANRYRDITNRAKTMACKDQKLVWVLNPAKENCSSCIKLNGKVKRSSQWERAGIRPQHPDLECGGWRCGCDLIVTDEPMSMGPLPRIP
jgi:hypothetical protein